jgi:hypothetical protein
MSSESKSVNIDKKDSIIYRIRNNDPIISRILSTKTSNYIEYINSINEEKKVNSHTSSTDELANYKIE